MIGELGADELNLEEMERRLIRRALELTGGNRTEAAKHLGISRRTMQRKLKEMGEVRGSEDGEEDGESLESLVEGESDNETGKPDPAGGKGND